MAAVDVLIEGMQQGRGIVRVLAALGLLLLARIGRGQQSTWNEHGPMF